MKFPISIWPLDALFPTGFPTRVPLMKIDIEGGECGAIMGALGLLRIGVVRAIFFEVNPRALAYHGCSEVELLNYILEAGFAVNKPCAGRRCGPTYYDATAFYPNPGEEHPCMRYRVGNIMHPLNKYGTGASAVPCNTNTTRTTTQQGASVGGRPATGTARLLT